MRLYSVVVQQRQEVESHRRFLFDEEELSLAIGPGACVHFKTGEKCIIKTLAMPPE